MNLPIKSHKKVKIQENAKEKGEERKEGKKRKELKLRRERSLLKRLFPRGVPRRYGVDDIIRSTSED